MSNYSKMYWLTRLDYIQGLLIFLVAVSVIGLILYYIGRSTAGTWEVGDKQEKTKLDFLESYRWIRKVAYPLAIICGLLLTFITTKEDMIFIYAGGKAINFVQSDTSINKIPAQTTKFISDYLEKTLKEVNVNK